MDPDPQLAPSAPAFAWRRADLAVVAAALLVALAGPVVLRRVGRAAWPRVAVFAAVHGARPAGVGGYETAPQVEGLRPSPLPYVDPWGRPLLVRVERDADRRGRGQWYSMNLSLGPDGVVSDDDVAWVHPLPVGAAERVVFWLLRDGRPLAGLLGLALALGWAWSRAPRQRRWVEAGLGAVAAAPAAALAWLFADGAVARDLTWAWAPWLPSPAAAELLAAFTALFLPVLALRLWTRGPAP